MAPVNSQLTKLRFFLLKHRQLYVKTKTAKPIFLFITYLQEIEYRRRTMGTVFNSTNSLFEPCF